MVIDGLMIGILRGGPNAFLTDWTFDPYLNSIYYTWYQMWTDTWSNALGNGVEAAISAVLALRVARAVVPSIGARQARGADAVDPFADPPMAPPPAPRPRRRARRRDARPAAVGGRAGMKRIAIITSIIAGVVLISG